MSKGDTGFIVVLTALDLEYRAVRAHLTGLRRTVWHSGALFEVGHLPSSPTRIALGRTGPGPAVGAILANQAIVTFNPRALVFVGMAAALSDDLPLGDVVVPTQVYGANSGKTKDGSSQVWPRRPEAHDGLLDLARRLDRLHEWSEPGPDGEPVNFRVHFEPIAAGDVMTSAHPAPSARQVHEYYADAIALEMEGIGIGQVGGYPGNAPPTLTVLGISETADGRKSAGEYGIRQAVAATHAATVAVAVLQAWIAPDLGLADADLAARGLKRPMAGLAPKTRATVPQAAGVAESIREPRLQGGVLQAFASGIGAVFDVTGTASGPHRRHAPTLTWRSLGDLVDAYGQDET